MVSKFFYSLCVMIGIMIVLFGSVIYIATVYWLLIKALLAVDICSGLIAIAMIAVPPSCIMTYSLMKNTNL